MWRFQRRGWQVTQQFTRDLTNMTSLTANYLTILGRLEHPNKKQPLASRVSCRELLLLTEPQRDVGLRGGRNCPCRPPIIHRDVQRVR